MADRISALAGYYRTGKFGILDEDGSAGIKIEEVRDLVLHQVAAWQDSIEQVGKQVAKKSGCKSAPGPCRAEAGKKAAMLRIEPLKWWLVGSEAEALDAEKGATLDISHSRTQIRISGEEAASYLNRHLSLDLREDSFPVGSVASTAIHHVGVTLWRSEQGYELFIPRGFALSIWEGMFESAMQFGVEVV